MPLNARLVVPVALGLSLVTVTAFVVYYVFKKEEDGETKKIKTSRMNTIEVTVPKSIVPALIGRNGSNIKDIERKSGARIHFKKFSDKDYDICILQGRTETTQCAETMVHEFIKNQPLIVQDSLLVPAWACGRIIGSGGENINEISHRSGARVKVEGNQFSENTNTRQITIRGTKEQIQVAKGLIEHCVAEEKCRREIEQSKRNSRQIQPGSPVNNVTNNGTRDVPNNVTTNNVVNNVPNDIRKAGIDLTDMPGDTAHKHVARKSEVSAAAIQVYVSAVSSPSRFWVQFVGPQVSQLDELVETMTDYYSNKDNREAHALHAVCVGQVVAAVFRHDGRWYRARVADLRANEFDPTQQVADVFFVDYGDSEYVAVRELCELRADMLRLRFQAMECFLAGVSPAGKPEDVQCVSPSGQKWEKWHPQAVERFEELTQVARWKALVSKTCSYKKTLTVGEKEREIPGIKLYDVTEEGELDIGSVLVKEGWAAVQSPRASPARASPRPLPFGDLGNSRVLGMSSRGDRAASVPKNHERDDHSPRPLNGDAPAEEHKMPTSQSLGSGLESTTNKPTPTKTTLEIQPEGNATKANILEDFLHSERRHVDQETDNNNVNKVRDDFKANMNRIDSHHGNLEALGRHN